MFRVFPLTDAMNQYVEDGLQAVPLPAGRGGAAGGGGT
jgi:hypothetical protein